MYVLQTTLELNLTGVYKANTWESPRRVTSVTFFLRLYEIDFNNFDFQVKR